MGDEKECDGNIEDEPKLVMYSFYYECVLLHEWCGTQTRDQKYNINKVTVAPPQKTSIDINHTRSGRTEKPPPSLPKIKNWAIEDGCGDGRC